MRKGQRPSKHYRKVKTKKGKKRISINPHIKKKKRKQVSVGKYDRFIKGKPFKVKKHKRTQRALGKKVTFKYVGDFMVGHDELGNFRGSKIKIKPKKKVVRKRFKRYNSLSEIDTDYFTGELNEKEWIDAQTKLMELR